MIEPRLPAAISALATAMAAKQPALRLMSSTWSQSLSRISRNFTRG